MVNPSRFASDPRIDKPWGSTLREKLPRSVRLRYINWGAKERQQYGGWANEWLFVLSVEGWPRARWSRSACSRVGSLPSSEAETRGAVEGLGGEASSEAEIVPRVRGGSYGPHCVLGPWTGLL